ncbi:MAG TPA: FAD-binding and (Fe-S)-binding domain-containing protein [Burkholderiales bacterium]|nr:FAD-binding and (Fe-S)-binding domain-containing protein [Burkholderiales bacterium]
MLPTPYDALHRDLAGFLPRERLVTDPLRTLAWGTDASFYRLVPKIVAVVESEEEVVRLLAACRARRVALTFRAAGTSLSGQAITDSVLALLGDGWRGFRIGAGADTIRLQPGIIGADANRCLAQYGRKIGPDPASIATAKIGGIAANNASGMCCGTAQNSYHTLAGIRVVLADGGVLDTEDSASVAAFRASHAGLLEGLASLARRTRDNAALAARIRHKFRMKNTTGYGLNALVDFEDPVDILARVMIGSEGTLGFISAITYRTVPEHADKASALILFHDLGTACRAVTALKGAPVEAVELMDRPALASVEHKPAMPEAIQSLGPDGAALLVETRAADAATLARQVAAIGHILSGIATAQPFAFSTDPGECARLWNVRKGMFPSVGAVRETGTTVLIEDVAFPVERLAPATLDLQALLHHHGYHQAIIFGHALEGNLHFVFTQDFNVASEVERYRRFMDDVAHLVVEKYDGALKAEHGTGRNMAPFVALEWGAEGLALMQEIKRLFDPENLLNPGVILNPDPEVHLKHLKPLPAADPLVDKCIECGFCEPKCPSKGLTLSPRQRIVGWREIARLEAANEGSRAHELRALYDYHGMDTCAACGLCATACPVDIETGKLIKALRGRRAGALARSVGKLVAENYGPVTAGVRAGLWGADLMHGALGTGGMEAFTGAARRLSGNRIPLWTARMPRATGFDPAKLSLPAGDPREQIVYFPSCAARNMGPARGDNLDEDVPTVTDRLLRKAGYDVVYPKHLPRLCCGQPFESKGLMEAADLKSAEMERVLREASEGGKLPIVFDTSPCAYRMKRYLDGRLRVMDMAEFLHDHALERLEIAKQPGPVAVHPVCSVRKQGLEGKLRKVAEACAESVVMPPDIQCCGWAGDKGFTTPELNAHALRDLKSALPDGCTVGYSSSRTCEIGLSYHSGVSYCSIVYLVDACSKPRPGDR